MRVAIGDMKLPENEATSTRGVPPFLSDEKAETKLSNKIATGVAAQWNGAHGKVVVDGVKYKVNFKVTYETVSEADASKMASGNTDIKNNFIRVEDGVSSSKFQLGGNAGWFNTDDDIGGSTTPAHEIGHGLGLDHTATGGQTKEDVPDIMEARGTQVHPRWSKVGKSNDIDPNFRRVSGDEVKSILKGVTFDKSGKGKIGTTTNKTLAGKGETVYLNKSINTALGKTIEGVGNWRPDVLSIGKNGVVNLTEVISPSQTAKEILAKVSTMKDALVKSGYKVNTSVLTETGKAVTK